MKASAVSENGRTVKRDMAKVTKHYTVYSRKLDELLAFGSAEECAKALGITRASFYRLVTMAKQRPNGKYEVLVEREDGEG